MSKIQEEKKNTEAAVAPAEGCEGYNGNPSGTSEESGFVGTVVSGGNSNESSPPKAFSEGEARSEVISGMSEGETVSDGENGSFEESDFLGLLELSPEFGQNGEYAEENPEESLESDESFLQENESYSEDAEMARSRASVMPNSIILTRKSGDGKAKKRKKPRRTVKQVPPKRTTFAENSGESSEEMPKKVSKKEKKTRAVRTAGTSRKVRGVRKAGHAARRERRVSSLFIAPSLIGILIFYALPFAVILFYAFVDNPINKEFVFLDNFISLFKNAAFKRAAVNTLKISLTAVPLAVVLSLFLAMALETNIPMKSRFRTFFLSPMMVPAASVVLIWQVLFHHNGAVNDIMSLLGLPGQDWLNSDYAPIVIVVLFLWKNLGYNMIIFMSALANIPRGPLEAAAVDGAGKFRQFVSIKLRYLSPSILFVMIISLINSFKVFREIYLLTGNYAYESLYTLQHYMNNMLRRLDYQKLSAASIVMFLVMVAIVGVLFIIENRFGRDVE